MNGHPGQLMSYAIAALALVIVLAIRIRGMRRTRPLRLERLWILPAIYLAFAVLLFAESPPVAIGWAAAIAGCLAGAAVGWQRGRLMRIAVDPVTHALSQQASPAALVFLLALVVLRTALRASLMQGDAHGIGAMMVTDIFVAFALGLFSAQRLEMYLRARRLLTEARAVE